MPKKLQPLHVACEGDIVFISASRQFRLPLRIRGQVPLGQLLSPPVDLNVEMLLSEASVEYLAALLEVIHAEERRDQ